MPVITSQVDVLDNFSTGNYSFLCINLDGTIVGAVGCFPRRPKAFTRHCGAVAEPGGSLSRFRRAFTNYYRRFPGDYLRDTQHLTHAQHGIYGLLLDVLYSTEKPIKTREDAYRITRCSKHDGSIADCDTIISEFFSETTSGIWHPRVETEIKYAESRRLKATSAANAKWSKHAPSNATSNAPAMRIPDSRLQTPEKEQTYKHSPVRNGDESEPKQENLSEKDLAELWRNMRRGYKRFSGKSLGSGLRGYHGENFRELVLKHGQSATLAGFSAFMDSKGKEYLRSLNTPIFLFLKQAEDWIDDASIQMEQPQDDKRNEGPRGLGPEWAHLVKH